MTFGNPSVLVLVALAPLAVLALYLYDRARRRVLTRRLGELAVIGKAIASASPGRRAVKAAIFAVAAALVMFALARPQLERTRVVQIEGVDLALALDVSRSMLVQDVAPTEAMRERGLPASRLARARELAAALVDALPNDRFAPIAFAGAVSRFPLTDDHEVAARFFYDFGPADLPGGSNLAEAIRVARCALRPDVTHALGCEHLDRPGHGGDPLPGEHWDAPSPQDATLAPASARGRAIVIVTDGGDPDPSLPLVQVEADHHGVTAADAPAARFPRWMLAIVGVLAAIALAAALGRAWLLAAIALVLAGAAGLAGDGLRDRAPPKARAAAPAPRDAPGPARVDPEVLHEIAAARELGIALFVVGVGTPAGGPVPSAAFPGAPPERGSDGQVVVSRRDDAGLRAIAAAGGDDGRYFVAAPRGEVDPAPIVRALHEVERGLATRKVHERRDVYPPFLFAALMLFVIEAAIGTRRRQGPPEAR